MQNLPATITVQFLECSTTYGDHPAFRRLRMEFLNAARYGNLEHMVTWAPAFAAHNDDIPFAVHNLAMSFGRITL